MGNFVAKVCFFVVVGILGSGCATILNDETQKVNVQTSNNTKTKISVDGVMYDAPGIIELPRQEKDVILQVQNKNCNQQMIVKSKVDGKFWINILSGGTFGSSTDYGTEEMWAYDDNIVINCK